MFLDEVFDQLYYTYRDSPFLAPYSSNSIVRPFTHVLQINPSKYYTETAFYPTFRIVLIHQARTFCNQPPPTIFASSVVQS